MAGFLPAVHHVAVGELRHDAARKFAVAFGAAGLRSLAWQRYRTAQLRRGGSPRRRGDSRTRQFQYAVLAIVWAGTIAFLAAVSRWSVATLARRSVAAGALLLPAVLPATAVQKVEVAGVTFPLSKACIPGADFARAYFSIWLGPQPISDDLKQALLGQP
jgi:hypothetical protein